MLDFGCGSGILALAALRLGAAHAVGVDNDPQALTATADNVARNGLAIDTYLPQDEPVATYPIVVANILASALDALADTLAARVAPGGRMAMSGILDGQQDELLARLRRMVRRPAGEQAGRLGPHRRRASRMSRAPSFVEAPAPQRRRIGEWIALLVLALLLAAQLFFTERAKLAANAQWRPVVSAVCEVARCTVPAWHEPNAFAMLSRDVIAVPGRPGVLRVQASIRNDARWPQPWPVLVLSLSDANGRLLASRRFMPRDYLGRTPEAALLQSRTGRATRVRHRRTCAGRGRLRFPFRIVRPSHRVPACRRPTDRAVHPAQPANGHKYLRMNAASRPHSKAHRVRLATAHRWLNSMRHRNEGPA